MNDHDNDKLLAKLLSGRKWPILHDPSPVDPEQPSASSPNVLVDPADPMFKTPDQDLTILRNALRDQFDKEQKAKE